MHNTAQIWLLSVPADEAPNHLVLCKSILMEIYTFFSLEMSIKMQRETWYP
jgi:hypothetical protein